MTHPVLLQPCGFRPELLGSALLCFQIVNQLTRSVPHVLGSSASLGFEIFEVGGTRRGPGDQLIERFEGRCVGAGKLFDKRVSSICGGGLVRVEIQNPIQVAVVFIRPVFDGLEQPLRQFLQNLRRDQPVEINKMLRGSRSFGKVQCLSQFVFLRQRTDIEFLHPQERLRGFVEKLVQRWARHRSWSL